MALAATCRLGIGCRRLGPVPHQVPGNSEGRPDGNGYNSQQSKQQCTGQHQMCHLVGSMGPSPGAVARGAPSVVAARHAEVLIDLLVLFLAFQDGTGAQRANNPTLNLLPGCL